MSQLPTSNAKSIRALFERARELPRQPEGVRARALGRARAAAAELPASLGVAAPRRRASHRLLVPAAAAALAMGLVGSVFALGGSWFGGQATRAAATSTLPAAPTPVPSATGFAPRVNPRASVSAAPEVVAAPESSAPLHGNHAAPSASPHGSSRASYGAELELMRSAHVAYARHDFTSALLLAGEHARRFPGGLLTEEREALRVRSLLGAGRVAEAQRAAGAFAARFPRSVLVRRLQDEVGTSSN